MDEWINALDGAYERIVRRKLEYLNVIEWAQKEEKEIAREQKIERQKQESDRKIEREARSREMEEVAFKQGFENLRVLMGSEKEKASPAVSVLDAARDDLKEQLQRCKKAHGEYVILLDTEKAHLETNWIARYYQDFYAQVSREVGGMVQQKRDDDSKSKESGSMRLERMKLPVICGNIRDFPRVRSDFEHCIMPELKSDEKFDLTFLSHV